MIVTGAHVRAAAEQTLKTHLPAVLAQLGTENDQDLPAPQANSWSRLDDFLLLSELQSPSIVVTCSGLPSVPQRDEDSWQPMWIVKAFVVVRGRSYEETAERVAWYTAAVRTAWLRNHSLDGYADGGQWRGEQYTELDRTKARTIAAGSVTFGFTVPVTTALTGITALTTHLDVSAYGPTHPAL